MDVDREIDIQEEKGGYTPWGFLVLVILTLALLYITYTTLTKEISQRKKVAEKQQLLLQKLKVSNTDLERYAYVASHDLQEPLRKIQVFTDRAMAHSSVKEDQKQKQNLTRIYKSAQRMALLINDLLEYGRIGGKREKKEPIDISKLFSIRTDELVEDVDLSVRQKVEEGIIVVGVESQVDQLVSNLLSNSIKFRDKKKKFLEVSISSKIVKKEDLSYLKVNFSDNGIGFENKYSDQIFTVFNRLVGRNEVEGTGIGLSICKRVMTVHNGLIRAESKNVDGATFSCYFPIDPATISEKIL